MTGTGHDHPAAARRRTRPAAYALALCCLLTAAPAAGEAPLLERVAEGVFVYAGPHAEADAGNQGSVGNATLVVGARAAALIDTGGSAHFGERLRAAIAMVTDRPLRYVILTHVHPDHMFGAAPFAALPGVQIVAHHKMPRAQAARGEHYRQAYGRLVGEAFDGTTVVTPGVLVEDRLRIDLGERTLLLTAHATAHTDHDLSVLDEGAGILFAGDLVFTDRLPVVDGSLKGWLEVMETLRAAPATRVVPGHGRAMRPWPEALQPQARYLGKLLAGIRGVIAAGGSIEQAIATVATDERGEWAMFERDHPRNVTASFTELEWE